VTIVASDELRRRLDTVPRPVPILDRDRERALTARQRELLDRLDDVFADGFAELTMGELAARLNCSLRTLYALAPSRDELVLVVLDRNLWRIGRSARDAIAPEMAPLDAVRSYLRAANVAVSRMTATFARDLAAVSQGRQLSDDHNEYLFNVTRTLLDLAVDRGDVSAIDSAAVARVLAGLGSFLARPEVIPTLRSSPGDAADEVLEVLLRGLAGSRIEPTRRHDGAA
jgi:AcrR family transcriptional regulator